MFKAIAIIKDAYGIRELDRYATKEKYKTSAGAYRAAQKISSDVERFYPWYQTVEYELYENGNLIEI